MTDDSPFAIDEGRLDKEWVDQPVKFHTYARRLADAKLALDQAKSKLDLEEAEVELDVRTNPDKYKIEGTAREGQIKARVRMHKRVTTAETEVNQAKHKVNVLEAAVNAMEHRKRALENLVTLWVKEYYAKPKAPDEAEAAQVVDQAKKARLYKHGRKGQ